MAIGDLLAETLIRRRIFSSPEAQQSDQKMVWVREVMQTMTSHRTNLCLVIDGELLCGIITDGDLRRNLVGVESLQGISARTIMNGAPICVQEKVSADEARLLMKEHDLHTLLVKDQDQKLVGLLTIGDLTKAV